MAEPQGLARHQALDREPGAVLLRLLAHEEGLHRRARHEAQLRDRTRDRHRPHLEPAHIVDALARERIEGELRQQGRALGIEHRGLEIEIEIADPAGRELDLSPAEGALMNEVAQPRARGADFQERAQH
jgi:hypothetical protein